MDRQRIFEGVIQREGREDRPLTDPGRPSNVTTIWTCHPDEPHWRNHDRPGVPLVKKLSGLGKSRIYRTPTDGLPVVQTSKGKTQGEKEEVT